MHIELCFKTNFFISQRSGYLLALFLGRLSYIRTSSRAKSTPRKVKSWIRRCYLYISIVSKEHKLMPRNAIVLMNLIPVIEIDFSFIQSVDYYSQVQ